MNKQKYLIIHFAQLMHTILKFQILRKVYPQPLASRTEAHINYHFYVDRLKCLDRSSKTQVV